MMSRGNVAALLIGALMAMCFVWIFSMMPRDLVSIFGVAMGNPETIRPSVRVENIGVHGIIGDGAHSHGTMTAEQQNADKEQHVQVESSIFFTPGGLYTKDDIAKNGPLSPSEKFKDIMSRHDLKPKPGDKLCPITNTKANDSFTWWVGGKRYAFCCPPCIEEFVLKAKKGKAPKLPDEYVQR